MQYQVRAESAGGAVMTFGVQAVNLDQAKQSMYRQLPFDPHEFTVTELRHGNDDCQAPQAQLEPPEAAH